MSFPPTLPTSFFPSYNGLMQGGSATQRRSGVATSHNTFSTRPENFFAIGDSSDGETGIAAVPARSGGLHSGLSNVLPFDSAASRQTSFPGRVPERQEQYDDAPYIPPRVPQAGLPTFPALDLRLGSGYGPANRGIQQQYPYEDGTSPSDSVESIWGTSSSSSASSQQLLPEYDLEPHSQTLRQPRPNSYSYHPAYFGQHRPLSEHARDGGQSPNTGVYYRSPQNYANLLAPETYGDTGACTTISSQAHCSSTSPQTSSSSLSSSTSHPASTSTYSVATDTTGPYLRQQLGLSPDEPVNLRSLPDPPPGEKPSAPLPMLIKLAIYGSPRKQLTLQEIYSELENRFKWFWDHKNDRAWKNSIRHNLSLNKVFKRVPRAITEPGKGSYWQLDISGGEGYKRTRKRRPRNSNKMTASEDEVSESDDPSQYAGPSRSPTVPVEDAHIDPELRGEGHVVGEGRTRRRAGGNMNPYPQQSPRYQQGPLPVVAGPDGSVPDQRFGQPAFGFHPYSQPQPVPFPASTAPFPAMTSSMLMAQTMPTATQSPQQRMDVHGHVSQLTPPSGMAHLVGPGGSPTALLQMHHFHGQSPERGRTSGESSSSGSSRTWKNAQSGSQ